MTIAVAEAFVRRQQAARGATSNTAVATVDHDTPVLTEGGYLYAGSQVTIDTAGRYLAIGDLGQVDVASTRACGTLDWLLDGVSQFPVGMGSHRYLRNSGGTEGASIGAGVFGVGAGETLALRVPGVANQIDSLGNYATRVGNGGALQVIRIPDDTPMMHLERVNTNAAEIGVSNINATRPWLNSSGTFGKLTWPTEVQDDDGWHVSGSGDVTLPANKKFLIVWAVSHYSTDASRHGYLTVLNIDGTRLQAASGYQRNTASQGPPHGGVYFHETGGTAETLFLEATQESDGGDGGTPQFRNGALQIVELPDSAEWIHVNNGETDSLTAALAGTSTHYDTPLSNVYRADGDSNLVLNGGSNAVRNDSGVPLTVLAVGHHRWDRDSGGSGTRKIPWGQIATAGNRLGYGVGGGFSRGNQGSDDQFQSSYFAAAVTVLGASDNLTFTCNDPASGANSDMGIYAGTAGNEHFLGLQVVNLETLVAGGGTPIVVAVTAPGEGEQSEGVNALTPQSLPVGNPSELEDAVAVAPDVSAPIITPVTAPSETEAAQAVAGGVSSPIIEPVSSVGESEAANVADRFPRPLPFPETFAGADSDPWPVQWIGQVSSGDLDQQSGRGRLHMDSGASAGTGAVARHVTALDYGITLNGQWASTAGTAFLALNLRGNGAWDSSQWLSPSVGYALWWQNDSTTALVVRLGVASYTLLGTITVPVSTAIRSFRFEVQDVGPNTVVRARSWTGGTEPETWDLEATDTTPYQVPGVTQLGLAFTAGTDHTVTVDDVLIDYLVTPIVVAINSATETEAGLPVGKVQPIVAAVAGGSETESGWPVEAVKEIVELIGQASEVEAAQSALVVKPVVGSVNAVGETELPVAVGSVKPIVEPVNSAPEVEDPLPVDASKAIVSGVSGVGENETPTGVDASKTIASEVGSVGEVEGALPVTGLKPIVGAIAASSEVEGAQSVAGVSGVSIGMADETETVQLVDASKTIAEGVSPVNELEAAQPVADVKPIVEPVSGGAETETVQPVEAVKPISQPVGPIGETETGGEVTPVKPGGGVISAATELEAAQPVEAVKPNTVPVGVGDESEAAGTVDAVKPIVQLVGATQEAEQAAVVAAIKVVVAEILRVSETETVGPVDAVKPIVIGISSTKEVEASQPIDAVKPIVTVVVAPAENETAGVVVGVNVGPVSFFTLGVPPEVTRDDDLLLQAAETISEHTATAVRDASTIIRNC